MPRCEFTRPDGQCQAEAMPGSKYCTFHGKVDPEFLKKRQYWLANARYRLRYDDLSEHDALKSLRDEVAMARMLLEERFNLIQNESELLAACGQLNTMLLTIERLVAACHKLDSSLGGLLAKPTLLGIAESIVEILLKELKDIPGHEQIVDKISDQILSVIIKARPVEEA